MVMSNIRPCCMIIKNHASFVEQLDLGRHKCMTAILNNLICTNQPRSSL